MKEFPLGAAVVGEGMRHRRDMSAALFINTHAWMQARAGKGGRTRS